MIFNLRWLPTVLGITICCGVTEPFLLEHQHVEIAKSTKKFKVRRPPPPPSSTDSRGFPGGRDAAINRACPSIHTRLVALAPEFVQAESGEKSVWGQTTQARPTLWFVVAGADRSTPLEFFLQDREDEVIYQAVIPAPVKDGVIGVTIPQNHKPLTLDRHYRWTLKAKFACGEFAPEQKYVDGWIQRVGVPLGLDVVGSAERGIWYDAVTSLAERRLQDPRNVQLRRDWRELLGAVNLAEFAEQPVLKQE